MGLLGPARAPSEEIEPDNCSQVFRDGCTIRVWYNGATQPLRVGADIRVILPASYTAHLDIVTEDNIATTDYPDRSDVTVKDLRGSADIEVDSGNVSIELADDVLEGPTCGPELVEGCWDYVDPETMEAAPWAVNCGCTDFGRLRVESRPERAANITVDVPGDLWATARMDNQQPGLSKDSDPACMAEIDCDAFGGCDDLLYDEAFPWKRVTEINDPGESALAGLGYALGDLVSYGCGTVPYVDDPDDFGEDPELETRGHVRVCSGCLELPGH